MELVIDMTDPVVGITYPTTSTAFAPEAGEMLEAQGTIDEDYLRTLVTELYVGGSPVVTNVAVEPANGDWNYSFDLSDVDFGGTTNVAATVSAEAIDCAGNTSSTSVEFTLVDEEAPTLEGIIDNTTTGVVVKIDENFKLATDVTKAAFTVTVNSKDFVVTTAALDVDAQTVTLEIDGTIIETGDVLSVSYEPTGTLNVKDTANNEMLADVTGLYTAE
jgi:hypothetical protein